jgi:hypothetical protein
MFDKIFSHYPLAALATIVLLFTGICYFATSSHESATEEYRKSLNTSRVLDDITNQVAADAEAQYNMVEATGDLIQMQVQAGMVEAAYLQAQDNENYVKWHNIRISLEKKIGL